MSDTAMKVSDIHGWGSDPDLDYLDPIKRVHMEMMPVRSPDWDPTYSSDSVNRIAQYADVYRQHGPHGMPAVVCIGDVKHQIAGMHRAYAAHVAGLSEIPAYVVSVF